MVACRAFIYSGWGESSSSKHYLVVALVLRNNLFWASTIGWEIEMTNNDDDGVRSRAFWLESLNQVLLSVLNV